MPAPTPLPSFMLAAPVTLADVRTAGLSAKVLRGSRFSWASRGLYLPTGRAGDLMLRAQGALRLAPPGSVLSHLTAARAWALPSAGLPEAAHPKVHITVPRGVEPPRRLGVRGHAMELPTDHVTNLGEVHVTTAARTTFDLASEVGLAEVVAMGDAALRAGLTDEDELRLVMAWGAGRRGVRQFGQAIDLMNPRAESLPESMLRVWFTLCGLPRFEPNAEVWNDTQLIARVDLLDRVHGVAVEYEGAYHRGRQQFRR